MVSIEVVFNKLVTVRKRQGLTQRDLAKLSGVSQPTIANIENGKSVNVNVQILGQLCKVLNVPSLAYITEIVNVADEATSKGDN